jgi:hypothetical protein
MPGNRWGHPDEHPRLQDTLTHGSLPDGLQVCVILRGTPLRMNWRQVGGENPTVSWRASEARPMTPR